MEEGKPGIVGHEVDLWLLIAAYHDHILYYSRCRSASEASQLEAVPVQMNRVNVVAGVPHTYLVSLAFAEARKFRIFVPGGPDGSAVHLIRNRLLRKLELRFMRASLQSSPAVPVHEHRLRGELHR
jgi:hypothetical protein